MIARRGVLGTLVVAASIAIMLTGCGRRGTVRYKMTVEVETPTGVRSGFAVREVTYAEGYKGPSIGESRPQWPVKDEAVAVDLGQGQVLFALLTGGGGDFDYGARIYGRALQTAPYPGDPDAKFAQASAAELYPTSPATYGRKNTDPLPMLVRFADLRDPKTVERVDPKDLAKSFGPGVQLTRITIAMTDEAVTVGIEERLGGSRTQKSWTIQDGGGCPLKVERPSMG